MSTFLWVCLVLAVCLVSFGGMCAFIRGLRERAAEAQRAEGSARDWRIERRP
jgi:flagellar biosynthesis/type III secretory pathway M-ring protein FliF/YscJ